MAIVSTDKLKPKPPTQAILLDKPHPRRLAPRAPAAMRFDPDAVRLAAVRFLTSRHPMVLLSLPGCGPCAISPAHWKTEDLHFPDARRICVRTVDDFVALVEWMATGQKLGLAPELEKSVGFIGCYCGKVLSILALRPKDCVHESHHKQFLDYSGALVSLAGWEFNYLPEESSGGRRVYRLLRTHSRLLAEGQSPVFETVSGLLEVRFVKSEYLRLVIEGHPADGHLSAGVSLLESAHSHASVLPRAKYEIQQGGLEMYRVLDRHLQEAFDRPERAVEILDKAKQLLSPGKEPNYPVIEIVTEIMDSPSSEGHVSNRLLKQRIREIRDRLWDAPVIAGQIRRELDLALQRPPFASIAARLSLEQRADLATVMMPLAKLETGDAYLNQDVA